MANDMEYRKALKSLQKLQYNTVLTANDSSAKDEPGIERACMTPFGPAWFRYGKVTQSGGCTRGELQSYKANATITNFTSGSTTTAVSSAMTADAYQYDILLIHDDGGAAGASPEGHCSPIVSNSATTIYLDPKNPLPAAVGNGDDGTVVSFCKTADAAGGDEVNAVFGVAMASLSESYWGWFQFDGVCPYALMKAGTAITAAKALIADTARFTVSSTSADQLLLGVTLGKVAAASDLVDDVFAVKLDRLGHGRGVSA